MVKVFRIVKDIGKAEGMIGFVVGGKAGSRYLGHGNDTGHQLLHVLIFRTQLSVWKDADLDSSVCPFLHLVCKFCHCNMYGMGLAEAVGQSKHHWVFCGSFCAGLGAALGASGEPQHSQTHSHCHCCCKFFHFQYPLSMVAASPL